MTAATDAAQLVETVLDSLAHLLVGIDERADMVWPKARVTAYDGFELMDPRLPDADDDFILIGDNPADMPVWPIDARWGTPRADGWLFKRVNTLDPKQWRGRLRFVLPRMCEIHETYIYNDGRAIGSIGPVGISKAGITEALAHNHPKAGEQVSISLVYGKATRSAKDDPSAIDVRLAQGVSLRREYMWSVLLGEEGVPRARFATDPIGVREAFRLRDIPPGRSRRAALRHWVSEHWRKRRDTSERDRIFIREFLRGAVSFRWNGLSCQIEPSREDQRRAERSKAS